MKKVIVYIFVVLSLNYSYAQDSPSILPDLDEIESYTGICLENTLDYSQMIQCNNEAIKKYDSAIENLLNNLKNTLSANQYKKLKKSQIQWEKYYNNYNNFLLNELSKKELSSYDVTRYGIKRLLKYNRAVELNSLICDIYYYKNQSN